MRIVTLTAAVVFAMGAMAQETAPRNQEDQQSQKSQAQADRDQAQADQDRAEKAQKDAGPLTLEAAVKKLHKCNQKEIMLGQLAMERGQSQEVKNFGQTLVNDHKKADQQVQQVARANNIELPKMADAEKKATDKSQTDQPSAPDAQRDDAQDKSADAKSADKHAYHDADIKRLKSLSGAEFDEDFSQHMVKDHEDTIALLDRIKADKELSELHELADSLRPGIEQHAKVAKNLAIQLEREQTARATQQRAQIESNRNLQQQDQN